MGNVTELRAHAKNLLDQRDSNRKQLQDADPDNVYLRRTLKSEAALCEQRAIIAITHADIIEGVDTDLDALLQNKPTPKGD